DMVDVEEPGAEARDHDEHRGGQDQLDRDAGPPTLDHPTQEYPTLPAPCYHRRGGHRWTRSSNSSPSSSVSRARSSTATSSSIPSAASSTSTARSTRCCHAVSRAISRVSTATKCSSS